jgi:hypothetical protein
MIFGTIGSANRLSCGVIGDTVNLASRIEGLTKFYGAGIIITEATYKGLPDPSRYQIREIDLVTVVGRKTPERIFEVFDSDSDELKNQKMQTATAIKEGLGLYRAGEISSALSVFEDCHARAPDDPLAQMLMQRCQRERDVVHDLDWDGIERMKSK